MPPDGLEFRKLERIQQSPEHLDPRLIVNPYYSDESIAGLHPENGTFGIRIGNDTRKVSLCVQDHSRPLRTIREFPLTTAIETPDGGFVLSGEAEVAPGARYGVRINGSETVYADTRGKGLTFIRDGQKTHSLSFVPQDQNYEFQHPKPHIDDLRILEAHVKGFTAGRLELGADRGTFNGLKKIGPKYVRSLGFNAIELLPVAAFNPWNDFAVERGLTDFWGYNPTSLMAPHPYYGSRRQFQEAVDAFHKEGVAVILDNVFNHLDMFSTGGLEKSLLALDRDNFHRRGDEYPEFSGCGRTPNLGRAGVLNLVLDARRYWATVMGVDGFRDDLATSQIRDVNGNVTFDHPYITVQQTDPILKNVIKIAEPWDLGPDGYQLEQFSGLSDWEAWDDRSRDDRRDFWRGEGTAGVSKANAARKRGRVSFLTAHDGFTTRGLVTYNAKHNEASLQNNENGSDNNHSWNSGVEGDTNIPRVNNLRRRRMMSMALDVAMTDGTIMMIADDEDTHEGNNDVWSLDSPIAWKTWDENDAISNAVHAFKGQVLAEREKSGYFGEAAHTTTDIHGNPIGQRNETSYNVWGEELQPYEYGEQALCQGLSDSLGLRPEYLCFKNGSHRVNQFTIPGEGKWEIVFDTMTKTGMPKKSIVAPKRFAMLGLSEVLLRRLPD